MRGSELMISDILEAIPEHWMQQQSADAPHWMGAFTRTEILIAVRGCTSTTSLFFEVGDAGCLQRVTSEDSMVSSCIFQRIRVIGIRDRRWLIDPDPDTITRDYEWRLWAWGSRPLAQLQWDPGAWQWRNPFAGADRPPTPFFQYTAWLGRHILMAQR